MPRYSKYTESDEKVLKFIASPEVSDTQTTIDNTGVPLPPSKSPAVSDEAKENIKDSEEKAKKELVESKPNDPEKGIDHPDNIGDDVYDSDDFYDYETDENESYEQVIVDYYDPDDVINADIGDYVPKKYTGMYDYTPDDVGNISEIKSSGLYIKSGSRTYFYNTRDGLAGDYLRKLMSDLDVYLKANVTGFLKVGFNAIMRSIEDTTAGGPNRSKTSKHGAGLAIDMMFDTTKMNQAFGEPIDSTNTYKKHGYVKCNKQLAKDKKLTKAIRKFLENEEDDKGRTYDLVIKWGGDFSQTGKEDRKAGVRISEYHHFEIKDAMMYEFFEPIKDKLTDMGQQVPQSQSQLGPIYQAGRYV